MNEDRSCNKCQDCIFRNLLFEELNIPEIENICKKKKIRKFIQNSDIVREGDTIHEFLYLKQGLVKLYKQHSADRDQIISIAQPNNFIGLLSVFSETKYYYSVGAIEDSEVCFIDLDSIKDLIKSNGLFALNILGKISKTADDIIKNNLEISKKNLRGKIAYILLYFSTSVYGSDKFQLPVSRREIAELIDMTTENVIRIISEFGKDKIINVKKKQIEIIDVPKLQKICELG